MAAGLFLSLRPVVLPALAQASQTNEQSAQISLEVPSRSSANALDVLVDRFSREITTGDRIVFDRFVGPAARLA